MILFSMGKPAHAKESTCCQSTCPRRALDNQDGASASPSSRHFAFTQSMTMCPDENLVVEYELIQTCLKLPLILKQREGCDLD